MKTFNLLWVVIFTSIVLLISVIVVSGYIYSYKDLTWLSMSPQRMDSCVKKISSEDDISVLKKVHISYLELEKEQAEIMREIMDGLFEISITLGVLTCSCLISWFFYVRAIHKERKIPIAEVPF